MLKKQWQDYASKARKIAKHIITGNEINRENGTRWSKIIDTLDVYATAALNDKFAKYGSISSVHTYWGGNQEIATEHKDGSRGLFQIHGVRQSSNNAMDIEVEGYMDNINENKNHKNNNMKKQLIRLTESDLHRIVEDAVEKAALIQQQMCDYAKEQYKMYTELRDFLNNKGINAEIAENSNGTYFVRFSTVGRDYEYEHSVISLAKSFAKSIGMTLRYDSFPANTKLILAEY